MSSKIVNQIPPSLQRFAFIGKKEKTNETSNGDETDETTIGTMTDVCGTDEKISISAAIHALRTALDLLKGPEESVLDQSHIRAYLDATAGALDEAALVLRPDRFLDSDEDTGSVGSEILDLVREVKEERSKLLALDAVSGHVSEFDTNDGNGSTLTKSKAKKHNETVLIVYASQTGTAKKYAKTLKDFLIDEEELYDFAPPLCKEVDLMSIRDVTLHELVTRKRIYFVVSTFGTGRPPRSAERFFQTLQMADYGAPLKGTEVAVCALGSSKFRHFCAFGSALETALRRAEADITIPMVTVDCKSRYLQRMDYQKFQDEVKRVELGLSPSSA